MKNNISISVCSFFLHWLEGPHADCSWLLFSSSSIFNARPSHQPCLLSPATFHILFVLFLHLCCVAGPVIIVNNLQLNSTLHLQSKCRHWITTALLAVVQYWLVTSPVSERQNLHFYGGQNGVFFFPFRAQNWQKWNSLLGWHFVCQISA